jgi:hypothetical protein
MGLIYGLAYALDGLLFGGHYHHHHHHCWW